MHSEPFRGSQADVTPAELRGPRYRKLFHDVYVRSDVDVDFALMSRAAWLLTREVGTVGGYSAAELLGAPCAPRGAPTELIVPDGRLRSCRGLVVRGDRLAPVEVAWVGRIQVTTPLRTAYDLARRKPLVEAVVAVDALARTFGFAPRELITYSYRRLGARGSAALPKVVKLANPLAESPMETRIRFAIVNAGLPEPMLQHPVGPFRLDMAYPELAIGIEYDGRDHLDQERAMRDLAREAYLGRAGWEILRFRASEVYNHPNRIAARVRSARDRRQR